MPVVRRDDESAAGDFVAKLLGMRTMVASDIREHFSDAIRSLDPYGESV